MTTYQNHGRPRLKQSLFGQWTPQSARSANGISQGLGQYSASASTQAALNAVNQALGLPTTTGVGISYGSAQTITDNTITTDSIANYVINTAAIGIFGAQTAQKAASSYFLSTSTRNPEPAQAAESAQPAYRAQYHAENPSFQPSQGLY